MISATMSTFWDAAIRFELINVNIVCVHCADSCTHKRATESMKVKRDKLVLTLFPRVRRREIGNRA